VLNFHPNHYHRSFLFASQQEVITFMGRAEVPPELLAELDGAVLEGGGGMDVALHFTARLTPEMQSRFTAVSTGQGLGQETLYLFEQVTPETLAYLISQADAVINQVSDFVYRITALEGGRTPGGFDAVVEGRVQALNLIGRPAP
jgi:hypothetical protein